MKTTRTRRSRQQWLELVGQHQRSGLSIAEFARQAGVNYQTFFQWCKKSPVVENSQAVDITPTVPEFIEISTGNDSEVKGSDWLVELDLGNGMQLRVRQPD